MDKLTPKQRKSGEALGVNYIAVSATGGIEVVL